MKISRIARGILIKLIRLFLLKERMLVTKKHKKCLSSINRIHKLCLSMMCIIWHFYFSMAKPRKIIAKRMSWLLKRRSEEEKTQNGLRLQQKIDILFLLENHKNGALSSFAQKKGGNMPLP